MILALYTPRNTEKKVSIHSGKNKNVEIAKINQFAYDPKTKTETTQFITLFKKKGKVNFFVEPDHKMRIYYLEEFIPMLKKEGFQDVKVYDNFSDKEVTESTKYPVFVAKIN